MTKRLRQTIADLLSTLDKGMFDPATLPDMFGPDGMLEMLGSLKNAYQDNRSNMTETSKRIEFLEERLETGVSKRQAARMLAEHDPRVGRKTAENLVYTNFSGQYQTSLRGKRKSDVAEVETIKAVMVADVSDDESLL